MVAKNENGWIDTYVKLLRASDDARLLTLKMKNFPTAFYKYRRLDKYTLDCLENNWLWASEPKQLNDPFESSLIIDNNEICRAFYTGSVFKREFKQKFNYDFPERFLEEIKNSVEPFKTFIRICNKQGITVTQTPEEMYNQTTNQWHNYMAEQEKNIRVCCFSTSNESLLMWSHYADCHKGICVEYDFIDSSEIRTFIQPVCYSDKRSVVNSIPEMNTYSMIIASISKSKDWEYEHEWRFLGFTKSFAEKKNNHLAVPTPRAIYLGGRFELNSSDEKQQLERIIKAKNVPVYQMMNHPTEYKLIRAD